MLTVEDPKVPDEKRVSFSLKVRPDLKVFIEKVALDEDRSPNNLAELLLRWACLQLSAAGDSLTLKKWVAQPSILGRYVITQDGHLAFQTNEGHEIVMDIASAVARRAVEGLQREEEIPAGKSRARESKKK